MKKALFTLATAISIFAAFPSVAAILPLTEQETQDLKNGKITLEQLKAKIQKQRAHCEGNVFSYWDLDAVASEGMKAKRHACQLKDGTWKPLG